MHLIKTLQKDVILHFSKILHTTNILGMKISKTLREYLSRQNSFKGTTNNDI